MSIYQQLFVTAAIFKTIRHKINLKTLKNVRYSKQKSKSRSEKLKIPSSVSYETKIVSEYDQEIPQSQTADNPVAPRGRAAQPSRDQEDKLSKAISSLFPIKMIAILEWT